MTVERRCHQADIPPIPLNAVGRGPATPPADGILETMCISPPLNGTHLRLYILATATLTEGVLFSDSIDGIFLDLFTIGY